MNEILQDFIREIREAIATVIADNPNAPELEVTREVVEGMLLGEDDEVAQAVRKAFKLKQKKRIRK